MRYLVLAALFVVAAAGGQFDEMSPDHDDDVGHFDHDNDADDREVGDEHHKKHHKHHKHHHHHADRRDDDDDDDDHHRRRHRKHHKKHHGRRHHGNAPHMNYGGQADHGSYATSAPLTESRPDNGAEPFNDSAPQGHYPGDGCENNNHGGALPDNESAPSGGYGGAPEGAAPSHDHAPRHHGHPHHHGHGHGYPNQGALPDHESAPSGGYGGAPAGALPDNESAPSGGYGGAPEGAAPSHDHAPRHHGRPHHHGHGHGYPNQGALPDHESAPSGGYGGAPAGAAPEHEYCEVEETPYGTAAASGGDCTTLGEMTCSGTGFNTCDYDQSESDFLAGDNPGTTLKNIYRDCAPGTACRPENGSILCDFPQN